MTFRLSESLHCFLQRFIIRLGTVSKGKQMAPPPHGIDLENQMHAFQLR